MKTIRIPISALQSKISEASNENMVYFRLTIIEEEKDQGEVFPAFIHFEAVNREGDLFDYESIDSSCFPTPTLVAN